MLRFVFGVLRLLVCLMRLEPRCALPCRNACVFLFGVLVTKDFNTGASWKLVFFLAMTLSLGSSLPVTGIMGWLADIIVLAFAPLASNLWLFMFGITVIMFLLQFADGCYYDTPSSGN